MPLTPRSWQVPEEVVDTVLEWIQQQDRKELKTGVWHTGIKGKLL